MNRKKIKLIVPAVFIGITAWLLNARVQMASLNQALCVAASQENTAAVERLLKRGASANAVGVVPAPNCDCNTGPLRALSLAVDNPSTDCVEQVGPVAVTFHEGGVDTAAMLLRAGADVNARDNDGYTALMLAHSARMVKFLLDHGAKVDPRDNDGQTALMRDATCSGMGEMNALITAGADVNARDHHGKTVLMFAVDGPSDPSNVGVARTLIAAGADVNARDSQGKTALWYALDNKDTNTIKFFKKIGALL